MSIDEHYIRLMNEEIDGVISEEDAKKLSRFIDADPEGKRYYLEMKDTVDAIEGSTELDPPPELRKRIFDSVYSRAEGAPSRLKRTGRSPWRSWVPVFAAGAAAGIILFAVLRPLFDGKPETGEYGATIGAVGASEADEFEGDGISGSVLPVYEDGYLTLEVTISSGNDANILLDFVEGAAFESIVSSEGAAYQMEVSASSLLLVHRGEAEYSIRLRAGETVDVDLGVFSGEGAVAAIKYSTKEK